MSQINVVKLGISRLVRHPENREIVCAGEEWRNFVASVKQHGVLTPLLVRPVGDEYQIVAGERRWEAASQLSLDEVPCVVKELSDEEALVVMMVENLQREDIDPIEEARGVALLIKQAGLTKEEVSQRICESAEWVGLRQGLLGLPEEAKGLVRDRMVSLGVMQMVLHLPEDRRDEGLQMVLHPAFQDEPLNARQAEQLLEEEIIAPARAKKEWEDRQGELQTHWTVELREVSDPALDAFILHVAGFEEKAKGQYARDQVYAADLTDLAPKEVRWLHLAQRHGLPVKIYPGKVDHENEKLSHSVAMVDQALVLEGEKALEGHKEGSAWLTAACKVKPDPEASVDPDAREDQEEVDREEDRNASMVKSGGSLSGWVDLGAVRVLRAQAEEVAREDDLKHLALVWGLRGRSAVFEGWQVCRILKVCDWVMSLTGPQKGGEEEE